MPGNLLPNAFTQIRSTKRGLAVFGAMIAPAVTPIRTGQAKANWFAQEGTPSTETLLFAPGETMSETSAEAVSKARTDSLPPAPVGDLFITNSLDYIKALEGGYSKQAPRGMLTHVRSAVLGKAKG